MSKFKKILSRLTYAKAKKILGPNGDQLLRQGGKFEFNIAEDVLLTNTELRVRTSNLAVRVIYNESAKNKLEILTSSGRVDSLEVGAVLSLILEEKMALGLAEPPKERVPIESLSQEDLVKQAMAERRERSETEKMLVESSDPDTPWADYMVTNKISGKTYRVALRGFAQGESYCSCPDFRNNRLGTCKHLMRVEKHVHRQFRKKALSVPYQHPVTCVAVDYLSGDTPSLRLHPGEDIADTPYRTLLRKYLDRPIENGFTEFAGTLETLEDAGVEILVHPDALNLLNQALFTERIERDMSEIRENPATHPLRRSLLKAELRPYQLDGIAFAVSKGRAILADDMGLGKTIQGIGVAELLSREAVIKKVLIICPASLKSQWCEEIHSFSDRSAQLVLGSASERSEQYDNDSFFTICNYEQVVRDITSIEKVKWDLIVLDEGQRIKNWETLTSKVIRSLHSTFALVLSGTPLENRLEELYNIVSFIDYSRLGPAYQFMNTHREVDEKGKVLGYKNLDQLRKKLKPILLRRTRKRVLDELPERNNQIVRITPHEEQVVIDKAQGQIINQIINKKFISEMDLLRLQKALLTCRMAADSTYLVNKEHPHHSTKLATLHDLIVDLMKEPDRKMIIFSEWTTMLDLIEEEAIPAGTDYVRLDGSVPQKKRGMLVKRFNKDPECRIFLTTNAGSTGLNLQAANTVINVDLPWNPAVLEQRIGRAHRMGQKRPVDVYILISEGMLEERILGLLGAKAELAHAALNLESDLVQVSMQSGLEELKRRLEILIAGPENKEIDNSMRLQVQEEIESRKRERVAEAGGKLLTAAFEFLGSAIQRSEKAPEEDPVADSIFKQITQSAEKNDQGSYNLNITLNESALKNLATTLSSIMKLQQ